MVVQLDTSWVPAPLRELGDLLDVEVLPNARVALLERFGARVIVLGASGAVDAEFGSVGEGPGEMEPRGLSRIVATDSSLWVPDLFQQRLTEFSFDGRLLGSRPFPEMGSYAVDWRRHPQGGLAYRVLSQAGDQLLHLREGRLDTLHAFPSMEPVPNLLLAPVPLWDVGADVLVLGRSDQWSVELRDLDSDVPSWIVRREGGPLPFTEQDRASLEEVLMASVARDAGE